jgi:hypothetical protein
VSVSEGYLNALLCRLYFQPYIVDVIEKLSESIYCVPISSVGVGRMYIDLVRDCLQRGRIPIGIYRMDGGYVYINPHQSDLLMKGDLVYLVDMANAND